MYLRHSLLHGLFPLVRAEILHLLFVNPRQELHVRELARLAGLALHTVQDELVKLLAAGLVADRSNGYYRFYRANRKHAVYVMLRRLVKRGAALTKLMALEKRRR